MKFKTQHKDFKPTASRSKDEKHTAHRDKKEIWVTFNKNIIFSKTCSTVRSAKAFMSNPAASR